MSSVLSNKGLDLWFVRGVTIASGYFLTKLECYCPHHWKECSYKPRQYDEQLAQLTVIMLLYFPLLYYENDFSHWRKA